MSHKIVAGPLMHYSALASNELGCRSMCLMVTLSNDLHLLHSFLLRRFIDGGNHS